MAAKLYGVGVGPGDPELLTLKAKRVLEQVSVIAAPQARSGGRSLALEVIKDVIDISGKDMLSLTFPMNKEMAGLIEYWQEAKNSVMKYLLKDISVAFVTMGDPMFHSTFIYLMDAVLKGEGDIVPSVEIVPGVSSLHCATASAGIPLASSHERVAILPATYKPELIRQALIDFDTVVFMKVYKVIDMVISILKELNLCDNAVFITRAGWPDEEVVREIESLKGEKLDYFSLIIVRKTP